jgi:outer membrane protein OmpA-like peptidoglycan-associated protein
MGSFSQEGSIIKGKKYYEYYDYYKTIEKFEPLINKTVEIKRDLANSYFNTGQYNQAENYFYQITQAETIIAEDLYNYVKVLLINRKYEEAEIQMSRFKLLAPGDSRAELFSSNKGFYGELLSDKGYFSIKNLNFNNDAQEFSPVLYGDKLVFSSSRKEMEAVKRRWNWNNLPFLDLYLSEYDTSTLEIVSFNRFNFNKKYHEGTATFTKAGDFMLFTSNNYKQKSKDGIHKLELYQSTFKNNKWQSPIPFPYNNPEYSVGHPCINESGDLLYFASDMPGGIGGVDLYVCTRVGDGVWTKPINLGKDINTEGNEMFPFIHKDGYLFFASDGRPGLGGLDLFVAKVENRMFSGIQNLGNPVNSNFDDFGIVFNENLDRGWFCSNRIPGKGNDDIYSFKLSVPFFTSISFKGLVVDNNGEIINNAEIILYDDKNNVLEKGNSNEQGKFEFNLERNRNYAVSGFKERYQGDNRTISTYGNESSFETKLVLVKEPEFLLEGTVFDYETHIPIDSVRISITDLNTKKEVEKISDSSGLFTDNLDGIRLNDLVSYSIIISKNGYLPFKRDFEIKYDHEGTYNINDFLKVEMQKINIGIDISKALNVNPIYFDLNKYVIRPDAAVELDKIVKVMNEYPTLVIELGSHTDSRGSDASNLTLSKNRAIASAKYIKARITRPERIYGKGYGESIPNKVNPEVQAIFPLLPLEQVLTEKFINSLPKEDREKVHQLNRRTEFKIISY